MKKLSKITKEEIKLCEIFHSKKRSQKEVTEFLKLKDGDKEVFLEFLKKYSDQVSKTIDKEQSPKTVQSSIKNYQDLAKENWGFPE